MNHQSFAQLRAALPERLRARCGAIVAEVHPRSKRCDACACGAEERQLVIPVRSPDRGVMAVVCPDALKGAVMSIGGGDDLSPGIGIATAVEKHTAGSLYVWADEALYACTRGAGKPLEVAAKGTARAAKEVQDMRPT